ncbi:hypothetical protein CC2G_012792 [Coprinopsis cinerea AmutBmut pab1-1]|nr:hypothetical protein CC2G_012792 [Coprinopsis cinerea AmutBmut pab1-1]
MPSWSTVTTSNAAYAPSYLPVFVVFGGTSGIGEAMVKAVARYTKGRAHIVVIGRNEAAANAIIAALPKPSEQAVAEGARYEFLACDVNLMKNIDKLAEQLKSKLSKINFLTLSAGVFSLDGWDGTEEGIDSKLASRYYSRFKAIHSLLPLLRKAKEAGEDVSAMSILGAGQGAPIDFDNLGLRKNYTGLAGMMQGISYNDLMVEAFAKQEPDIGFTHIYPGFVNTGAFKFSSWYGKLALFLLRPVIWLVAMKPDTCAEYMMYALLNNKKGMHRQNQSADDIGTYKFPEATEEQKEKFWKHSVETTTVS